MPLTMTKPGTKSLIKRISGKDDVIRFLASLGFIVGEGVTVIMENGGNVIVNVKDSRIAISKCMANRIMV